MAANDGKEKTEKPTPRRLEKAKKEGTVAHSREVPGVAALALGIIAIGATGSAWKGRWATLWNEISLALSRAPLMEENIFEPIQRSVISLLWLFAPILLACASGALVFGWGQMGFRFTPGLLKPKFDKLNPITGFGRLVSIRQWVDAGKTALKASGFGFIAYLTLKVFWAQAPLMVEMSPAALAESTWALSSKMLWQCTAFFVAIAVWDYAKEFRRVSKDLRMTLQEVKDENKETEGNPQIKSRIRTLMRKMSSRRMMSQVPKADVVVTNPTHLAVAIQYRSRMRAPEVVAKGAGLMAQRIRETALANGVPLLENKPLAQLLYKKVEVGDPVPVGLYQAVAEVLAYVYRLKNRVRS
ncbi:MAG: flagellar biosynthesis protein FlhB [Elusimicrobia bacterium]|jgi:flagellar biosynthetic protein FlhB|nr:flagellar biosynthesis protein FlhB [Elusimicrobiota bacterium]